MNVKLAMVHSGQIEWPTVESLIRTLGGDSTQRQALSFTERQGIYVPAMRQEITLDFLRNSDDEWLFFLDADVVWKLNDVYEIVDSADAKERPVVMGLVFLNGPHGIRAAGWRGDEQEIEWRNGGMQEASVVGTGFTVYHRDALTRVQDAHGSCFAEAWEDQRFFGEDVAFSLRAGRCGIPLYVNCDVRVGHIKRVMLDAGWAQASIMWQEQIRDGERRREAERFCPECGSNLYGYRGPRCRYCDGTAE